MVRRGHRHQLVGGDPHRRRQGLGSGALRHQGQAGHGWYHTALPVAPADLAKKHQCLFFGGVDEDCWVYLNGELIDHTLEAA